MIEGRLVNHYYTTRGHNLFMNVVVRCKDKKHHIEDIPANLNPYGFVPASYRSTVEGMATDLECDLKISLVPSDEAYFVDSDHSIVKVEAPLPKYIGQLRRLLDEEGYYDAYEMDWRYSLRHMNDKGYGLFVAIDDEFEDIHPITDPQTIEQLAPYRWVFWDIENDDRQGMGNYRESRILCIVAITDKGEEYRFERDEEDELIRDFLGFLHHFDFPISWTLYDKDFLEGRCKQLDKENKEMYELFPDHDHSINFDPRDWCWLDFQRIVCQRHPEFTSGAKLALDEFAWEIMKQRKKNLDRGFYDTWVEDPERLVDYCAQDVQLMYDGNEKLKFIEMEIMLGEFLGLPLNELMYPTVMVAKRAFDKSLSRDRRCIWRSRKTEAEMLHLKLIEIDEKGKKKKKGFEGATVIPPVPGFHKNVVILDFESLYNNIMQIWEMSPEQWNPKTKKFDRIPSQKPIFPETLEEYTLKRKGFKQLRSQASTDKEWERYELYRQAIKPPILVNWGVIGKVDSRFFIKEVAEMITGKARMLLQLAVERLEYHKSGKFPIEIIYGDTDSIMIKFLDDLSPQSCVEMGQWFAQDITNHLQEYLRTHEGIDSQRAILLQLKLEKVFTTFLLGDVKKRYSGVMVWQDGKGFIAPKLYYKGHERVRKERCWMVRNLQETIFKMIHTGFTIEQIIKHLKQVKTDLFAGKHDKDLILAVGLSKKLTEYQTASPYVRAGRILDEMGRYLPNMKVKYVFLTPDEVWPVAEGVEWKPIQQSGYEHYWTKRTMTWLSKILKPFISPDALQQRLNGVKSLEEFF